MRRAGREKSGGEFLRVPGAFQVRPWTLRYGILVMVRMGRGGDRSGIAAGGEGMGWRWANGEEGVAVFVGSFSWEAFRGRRVVI